jgi:hypothetical protein
MVIEEIDNALQRRGVLNKDEGAEDAGTSWY